MTSSHISSSSGYSFSAGIERPIKTLEEVKKNINEYVNEKRIGCKDGKDISRVLQGVSWTPAEFF